MRGTTYRVTRNLVGKDGRDQGCIQEFLPSEEKAKQRADFLIKEDNVSSVRIDRVETVYYQCK